MGIESYLHEVIHRQPGDSEIWVINSDGSNLHRLGDVEGQGPDWSPDGSKITYFNYVDGGGDIWIMNSDGSNPIKLTDNPSEDWWPKFSPDGSKITFQSKRDGNHEIYVMNIDGTNQVRITNNSIDDEDPNWSPDGTKIAFISMRDGHYEIYTMNADGSNQTRITNTNGQAIDPDWKPITNPNSVNESGQSFNSLPKKIQLFQNYPNPFNTETVISFELKIPARITMRIFNVFGKEIQTLIENKFYNKGHYSFKFDASDVSSGIYFYKINSDHGFSQIKKMCLLK
ncbi:MAG: T9SS type A sorting domain-containing protein [Ignavibacteriaceae bacterium]